MLGKKKGGRRRALRIYFATDLHGSEVCFRKFLAAAKVYEANVIILGGDFAGKAIVPASAYSAESLSRWCASNAIEA